MPYTPKRYIEPGSAGAEIKKLAEGRVATTIAAEATANGSDAATTQALANALKTKLNAVIAALKAAGLMASS